MANLVNLAVKAAFKNKESTMRYFTNDIPKCPICNEQIDTYVDEQTPLGVQNIALHKKGEVNQFECGSCYEWLDVENRGGGIFLLTKEL